MKIIKLTEGFVTNSSSYSGYILIAVRKRKTLSYLLDKIGISYEYSLRFGESGSIYDDINFDDLKDDYEILEATVTMYIYGDPDSGGELEEKDSPLREFIEFYDRTFERQNLVSDDLILLYCYCEE